MKEKVRHLSSDKIWQKKSKARIQYFSSLVLLVYFFGSMVLSDTLYTELLYLAGLWVVCERFKIFQIKNFQTNIQNIWMQIDSRKIKVLVTFFLLIEIFQTLPLGYVHLPQNAERIEWQKCSPWEYFSQSKVPDTQGTP